MGAGLKLKISLGLKITHSLIHHCTRCTFVLDMYQVPGKSGHIFQDQGPGAKTWVPHE